MSQFDSGFVRGRTLALLLAVSALVAVRSAAGTEPFHLRLKSSNPAANDTLAASPTTLELAFTEEPELAVTSLTLLDVANTAVPVGKPVVRTEDRTRVVADLRARVAPGTYRVEWRTMSRDGHAVRGVIPFVVRGAK